MKAIYILTKSYELNDVPQYSNEPSTFALTKKEAEEILANSLEHFKRLHADEGFEVLGYDDRHLHFRYYTDNGESEHDETIWVTRVLHGTWAW